MLNHFTIELDTTGPKLEVNSPRYAIQSSVFEFTLEANEELDPTYQEAYLISPDGREHKLTLFPIEGIFLGKVNLKQFPVGSALIRAQVRDTVHNLSNVVERKFNIVIGSKVVIDSSARERTITTTTKELSRR